MSSLINKHCPPPRWFNVVYRKPPAWVAPRPAWARGVGE